jgi:hypothetical protein
MPASFGMAPRRQDVLALVLVGGGLEGRLDLVAGGGGQGLVVVDRDQVEDERPEIRVAGPEQRLRAAGALLEVQPDDGGLAALLDVLGHLLAGPGREAHGACGHGADLDEVSAGDALGLQLGDHVAANVGHSKSSGVVRESTKPLAECNL